MGAHRGRVLGLLGLGVGILLLTSCAMGDPPQTVLRLRVEPDSLALLVGQARQLAARTQTSGGELLGATGVLWQSDDASIATVSETGRVTGLAPGTVLVHAVAGSVRGSARVTVRAVPVSLLRISPTTVALLPGNEVQLTATTLDTYGDTLRGRTVRWSSRNPSVAAVSSSGRVTGITPGTTAIAAETDSVSTEIAVVVHAPPLDAPRLTTISTDTLRPGERVTVRGSGFVPVPGANVIVLRGDTIAPLMYSTDSLSFVVPCRAGGPATIAVRTSAGTSTPRPVTLSTPTRTLGAGDPWVAASADESHCQEMTIPDGSSRYLVVAFSVLEDPQASVAFSLSGNGPVTGSAGLQAGLQTPGGMAGSSERLPDTDAHTRHLDNERALYARWRDAGPAVSARPSLMRTAVTPPVPGGMRSVYYNLGACSDSSRVMRVRAVHVGSRVVIWEDSANVVTRALDGSLDDLYRRLGDMADESQYDVVRRHFADPLRRDGDADGRMHVVVSQRVNESGNFAFVSVCDLLGRASGRWGSNGGEFIYAAAPTARGGDLQSTRDPPGWFAAMTRTLVHEMKHVASMATRLDSNAPVLEASWLEEGTARHAEEIWMREAVYRRSAGGNVGYGTATDNGLYCDFNPAAVGCVHSDRLYRPSWGMRRHWQDLYTVLSESGNRSLFGDGTGQSGGVYYGAAWSLLRYLADRLPTGETTLFNRLTNSTVAGLASLSRAADRSASQMLGEWALALYADDAPPPAAISTIRFDSWNLRDVFTGLQNDPAWSAQFARGYPLLPVPLPMSGATTARTLRGGATMHFLLAGGGSGKQLVHLASPAGGAPSPHLRLAILRLQ